MNEPNDPQNQKDPQTPNQGDNGAPVIPETSPVMSRQMRQAMLMVGGRRAVSGMGVAPRPPKPPKLPKPRRWKVEIELTDQPQPPGDPNVRQVYLTRQEIVHQIHMMDLKGGVSVRLVNCSRHEKS